jgi:hypothetical protein
MGWGQLILNNRESGAPAPGLATPDTTRRQAVAGLLAAAASFVSFGTESAAKKKSKRRKKRRNRKKRSQQSNSLALQKPNVALGAYLPRALDDAAVLTGFHQAIGRSLDFVIWYEGWSRGNFDNGHRQYLATLDRWNMTPVISWGPFDANGPTIDQPTYRLANITRGDFDGYIDSWAAGLKAYGKPVYLKFAHEMNGNWFPWGVGVNGNQPGDFVAAWRHIHDRFASTGVTNVRWIWNPNVVYSGIPATLQQVYPGHDYVDWVGMNGYNWGTSVYWASCPCRSTWETFSQVFDRTYRELTALANKPIFIGEFASSEAGGNKAKWISDALLQQLPDQYPRVKAIAWFSKIATGLDTVAPGDVRPTAEVDWRVTSSNAARKAFAEAVKTPYYQATLG